MARDKFEQPANDSLASAHARIDAFLDEIAEHPPGVYSSDLDVTGFETGKAICEAPATERGEIAAAALIRYTAVKRHYTGGSYSPSSYTEHDYATVVERLASKLLRSKLPMSESTIARLVTETMDQVAHNVRTFPVKGLLTQLELYVSTHGALPASTAAALADARKRLAEDAARYKSSPAPAIIGHVLGRIDGLHGVAKKPKPRTR